MAYKFEFDETRKLITVTAVGANNMNSSLESLRVLRSDPRFRPEYRILCNFLDTRYVPDSIESFGLGIVVVSFFSRQKIALVVAGQELERLRELVAKMTSSKVEINVFDEMNAAERWLN